MTNIYEQETHEDTPVNITLEELVSLKEECKTLISNAECARNLLKNEDFKKVIQVEYFENQPKRLGLLIASGRMPPASMEDTIADLKSIGNLANFLNDVIQKGEIAKTEIANLQEAYDDSVENS